MSRRRAFTFAVALCTSAAPRAAAAHDLWLIPPESAEAGAKVTLRATQGMAFPEDGSSAPKLESPKRAEVYGPDGHERRLARGGAEGAARQFSFEAKQEGLHIAAIDTAPRQIRLDGPAFDAYLVSDGMPHVYRARHEAGELGRPAHERYQKLVKALVLVGDGPSTGWDRRLGQALEIVPLEDPFAVRAGGTLAVQVFLRGKPLAGARLGWDRPEDGPEPTGTTRADSAGRALIPIVAPGLLTIRLTHMERDRDRDPEWSSLWTTLTVRAGQRAEIEAGLAEARRVHGAAGPFVMAGWRIGKDAAARLGVKRPEYELEVVHHTPEEVQYSCVADGVQAATGASPGKLNFTMRPAPRPGTRTEVRAKAGGPRLVYRLTEGFLRRFLNVPRPELAAAAEVVARLPAAQIFTVERAAGPASRPSSRPASRPAH